MNRITSFLLYFLSFSIAGYAVYAYGVLPLGAAVLPEMKVNFIAHSTMVYTHIFASILALILGPLQFSSRFRINYQQLHRWIGRVYLSVAVLIGGLSGLYISQFAMGGVVAKIGFATLAVLWLYTGLRAYLAIRAKQINQHQKWMRRNFALTFAAVTLRVYLPLFMLMGIEFVVAYAIVAWLCWVPNLLYVEVKFQS